MPPQPPPTPPQALICAPCLIRLGAASAPYAVTHVLGTSVCASCAGQLNHEDVMHSIGLKA